jgi:ribosomal protein S18 acetylase RimI-like enzyme
VAQALRLAVEIPSYRRAATTFGELLHLPLSKSRLQQLVQEAGQGLVVQEAAEAEAMVRVPSKEEEVVFREAPEPDSEIMNVSTDGVYIRLRSEGWKEVKTVAISAVEASVNPTSGEVEAHLTHHSYRAGLWEAATCANHLWAEASRRGLEKARLVVSVNDGAAWIWAMIWMCFARCVQILDWWHAVQYLWTIAGVAFGEGTPEAAAWVSCQKTLLAQSNLRQVLHHVRLLYPRGSPLPDPVRKAVLYLFDHRWRMRYREFRQAGCPIGSGTVESACKVVVQQRMCQAGMQWSRPGAQAMLALRCALLSDRWASACAVT